MGRKVVIKTSLLVNSNGVGERLCHSFSGEWNMREDTHLLSHDEEENQGRTHILLGNDFVEIRRKGLVSSRMRFVSDNRAEAEYNTPHGQIPMTIVTNKISRQPTAAGGKFCVCYIIQTNGENLSENRLEVEWETTEE